jgi:AcrR family transcriptional regulator
MNLSTRDRLLEAAAELFARHGYRGASVRRICDQARANPGAVSYHFGGKRQLYRIVLRRAASGLSEPQALESAQGEDAAPPSVAGMLALILERLERDRTASQLLLRDLTAGGGVAVEALEPPLRSAFEVLRTSIGDDLAPRGSAHGRALFLDLAAPLFLLTAAWPVLERALDLDPAERRSLLDAACRRTLEAHGYPELG